MAITTTAASVRKILHDDIPHEVLALPNTDIEVFITIANRMVEDLLGDCGYTSTQLELIERYLSAHFLCINKIKSEGASESTGSTSVTRRDPGGFGLNGTHYGTHAMLLDSCGKLAEQNQSIQEGRKKARLVWMGSEYNQGDGTTEHAAD